MNEFKDEVLVTLAQDGNKDAEELLISRYKGLAKGKAYIYYIAGADKEDIIQEGMIGIFKAIRDFDNTKETSFHTFADMCITRQILTAIKKATRLKHSPLNSYISINKSTNEDDSTSSIIEMLESHDYAPESAAVLKEVIDDIGAREKEIFSDFEWHVWVEYLQGHTYIEIADTFNKSPKSIDNALQRIKKKVEKHMT